MATLVFAYGTLMRGYSNHGLLETSKFMGTATTVNKYSMFAAEFPFVNPSLELTIIYGEVYEVSNDEVLLALDELEGHPNWYIREEVPVHLTDQEEIVHAYIYFNYNVNDTTESQTICSRVESGNYRIFCPLPKAESESL